MGSSPGFSRVRVPLSRPRFSASQIQSYGQVRREIGDLIFALFLALIVCAASPHISFTMGWLSLRHHINRPAQDAVHPIEVPVEVKPGISIEYVEHTEDIEHISQTEQIDLGQQPNKFTSSKYPFQDSTISEDALPFIPPSVVRDQRALSSQGQGRAWIVVNDIIYDCTAFLKDHPGGDTVIKSFIGEDCSWQFWRFHSQALMDQYGRSLRVGRTKGVENRFLEPPKFFGSRRSHKFS